MIKGILRHSCTEQYFYCLCFVTDSLGANSCTLYPGEVEQEGQVVWILMVVSPIMQEQCPNCGLGCLGRNNVLPLA